MGSVLSFKEHMEKKKTIQERKEELFKKNDALFDRLDSDDIEDDEWWILMKEITCNTDELHILNGGSLDDEDYLRIIIDDTPPDLRERNELIKALENARENGVQIKDEDIEKLIKKWDCR